jgi:hypothetical protein
MKTTNNLKNAAKMTAAVIAALLMNPVMAADSADAVAALNRLNAASALTEKKLIYSAPDAAETAFTVAARLENYMMNIERSLAYTAPDNEVGIYSEAAVAMSRLDNKAAAAEAALIYKAPWMPSSPTAMKWLSWMKDLKQLPKERKPHSDMKP